MCQLSGQQGFLNSAIPLSCPLCESLYLRHRDYSCSSCQQRASFRLSLLHSMTSAEPSHLQHKTPNMRERLPPHTHTHTHTLTKRRKQTPPHHHLKFMPKYDTKAAEALFKTDWRLDSTEFLPSVKAMRWLEEAPPATFYPPFPPHRLSVCLSLLLNYAFFPLIVSIWHVYRLKNHFWKQNWV